MNEEQLEALRLFSNGYLLADGRSRYGRIYTELTRMGLVAFDGYEYGKRKFRLTDAGLKAIMENAP